MVQCDCDVAHVGAEPPDLRLGPQFGLAQLEEDAAGPQQAQPGRDGRADEAVEHHVHRWGGGKSEAAGIMDFPHAQCGQSGPLGGAAGGGDDVRRPAAASATAASPTPPVAAWISTRWPGCSLATSSKASRAVSIATGCAAATRVSSAVGRRQTRRSSAMTWLAKQPEVIATTVSPATAVVTSRPTATTVPAHSAPGAPASPG